MFFLFAIKNPAFTVLAKSVWSVEIIWKDTGWLFLFCRRTTAVDVENGRVLPARAPANSILPGPIVPSSSVRYALVWA